MGIISVPKRCPHPLGGGSVYGKQRLGSRRFLVMKSAAEQSVANPQPLDTEEVFSSAFFFAEQVAFFAAAAEFVEQIVILAFRLGSFAE